MLQKMIRLKGNRFFYMGVGALLLLGVLRGIEFHVISSSNSVSMSISYRFHIRPIKMSNRSSAQSDNQVSNKSSVEILLLENSSGTNVSLSAMSTVAISNGTSQPETSNSSDPEICFMAVKSACHLSQCGASPVSTHYRGALRDLSTAPHPVRRYCRVCRIYSAHCVVSIEHRFIFIHVMKSGGSSMHLLLKSGLCRLNNTIPSSRRPSSKDYACESHQFQTMGCSAAIERYPGFFRWALARHPVPRAVSGWAMASRRPKPGSPLMGFNEWAMDPSALRTHVWEMHWWPQAAFLLDGRGCPLYHYLGTLGRSLPRDMEAILHRIGSPGLWAAYARGGLPREYATANHVRDAAYRNLSAAAAAALADRYRVDLRVFGFRMDGWQDDGYF
jgi:hypothetical protein